MRQVVRGCEGPMGLMFGILTHIPRSKKSYKSREPTAASGQ